MSQISIEIKARCPDPAFIRNVLKAQRAEYKGLDHQIDTYFCVPSGRLKLRQGNIENALIYYKRSNRKNSKQCDSTLYPCSAGAFLKKVLVASLGVLAVVDKKREIFYIKNAKYHLDRVQRLGTFVEIEVFGSRDKAAKLREQCEFFQKLLKIKKADLLADSYSDQLLRKKRK